MKLWVRDESGDWPREIIAAETAEKAAQSFMRYMADERETEVRVAEVGPFKTYTVVITRHEPTVEVAEKPGP